MDTVEALVEQMVAAGEWPEPALLEAILAQGEKAVPPLVAVLRRDLDGWPEVASLSHALGLLSMLPPSPVALPALIDLFRRYDGSDIFEEVLPALMPFGRQIIEPCLAVVRDPSLDWYTRAMACNAAFDVSYGDPEARPQVLSAVREILAGLVERARTEELSDSDSSFGDALAADLACAADPEARTLVETALDAGFDGIIGKEGVERVYREGEYPPQRRQDWLAAYRAQFEEHRLRERRRANPPAPRPPRPVPPAALLEPLPPFPPTSPIVSAPKRKIGRNDPCWCGSGKKYKNCHLRADQG